MNQQHTSLRIPINWAFYLFIGLIIESCCLIGLLFGWMTSRGIPPRAILELGMEKPLQTKQPTTLAIKTFLPTSTIIDDSESTPFYNTPAVTAVFPSPSPSAEPALPVFTEPPPGKIVFVCIDGQHDQICLMNADGANRQQLTFEKATSFYPSLSPDGSMIIFSSNRDGNFEIYMMDLAGRNPFPLTSNIGNLYAPEISPKGNRIVFTRESGGIQDIWVMRMDGSNARPLFQGSGKDIDPTWAPDAQQVAFTSSGSGITNLFIANLENGKVFPVSRENLPMGGRSSWSTDGKWLAFYAGPPGDHNIYIVSPGGGALQQLTFGGDNLGPSFSPDNQWIAFTSYRAGNNDIYILEIHTGQAYRLTFTNNSDWQPRWGP